METAQAKKVLEEVHRRGGSLTAEGADLKVTPRTILDAGLRAAITHHKSVLMRMLRSDGAVVVPEAVPAPDPGKSFTDHPHEAGCLDHIFVHMPSAEYFVSKSDKPWIIRAKRFFRLNERFLEQLQITAARPLTTAEFRARVQQINDWWAKNESDRTTTS
ncbi:MAG: hypothetical protein HQK58_06815 [Deltaproteobacteria bacterium]|nr:hypothetical protein [Deltaproteobacteria bacterium]